MGHGEDEEVSGNSCLFLAVVWESGWLLDAVFPTPGTTGVAELDKIRLIYFSWAPWLF